MKAAQIRQKFIEFFVKRSHEHVPSSALVPNNDPTLLFTNSGMVQFKGVFLGLERRPYQRAVTAQRCMRAGGKHNDLDNVGYTARHHTFFEMLGNFSFGDYFKEQAIANAWEFVTQQLGLESQKLLVTVHHSDEEAARIWHEQIGVPRERIIYLDESNFWQMGNTGPCGPCSEIFYDHGPGVTGGPPGSPDEDGDRYIEIWNLVFMQFERNEDGSMVPLPKPSVDTGMGLERVTAVLQGVHSNYETDLFAGLLDKLQAITGNDQRHNSGHHVIVDHIRASAFMIADGIIPDNAGRGYVLRRVIRRALRHGHKLGVRREFFAELLEPLFAEMGPSNPQLLELKQRIEHTISSEERQFLSTLEQGMSTLEKELKRVAGARLDGRTAFRLYDSCGFPLDLTQDVCRERGISVDVKGFELAMQAQRERARSTSNFQVHSLKVDSSLRSEFVGYNNTTKQSKISALYVDERKVEELHAGSDAIVVLDECPFYPQSGGQLGDSGMLFADGAEFEVHDCQRHADALLLFGKMLGGSLKRRQLVQAQVDSERRRQIAAHHSATHLLHAALRSELGAHVEQRGSMVSADRLRFDFTHSKPLDAGQLARVQRLVNEQIRANSVVNTRQMKKEEALRAGAMALFGEKYDDDVRVVQMGTKSAGRSFSLELCGGTHVSRTGDLGNFYLLSDAPVAAGIRRVEALTAASAGQQQQQQQELLHELTALAKIGDWRELGAKFAKLQQDLKSSQRDNEHLRTQALQAQAQQMRADFAKCGGVELLVRYADVSEASALRVLADDLKSGRSNAVVVLVGGGSDSKHLLCACSKALGARHNMRSLLAEINAAYGGNGGGRPDFATGGLPRAPKVEQLQQLVKNWLLAE